MDRPEVNPFDTPVLLTIGDMYDGVLVWSVTVGDSSDNVIEDGKVK